VVNSDLFFELFRPSIPAYFSTRKKGFRVQIQTSIGAAKKLSHSNTHRPQIPAKTSG
jgi:hypothetical protein